MKHPPTESDWRSVPWCLDMPYAYDHFFGKTQSEAIAMFANNAISYSEDLMTMPTRCLNYYIKPYMDYLLCDQSQGDSDGAYCFFGLIQSRKADIRGFKTEIVEQVFAVLHKLSTQQEWYDADPGIYGSFPNKSKRAIESLM